MGIVVVARFAAIAPLVVCTTITSTGIRIKLASGSVYCQPHPMTSAPRGGRSAPQRSRAPAALRGGRPAKVVGRAGARSRPATSAYP
jgi:hypothetical protein